MLVLDKSRAIDQMLWLSQRAQNAVPEAFQRPSALAWALAEDGRRILTNAVVLRPSRIIEEPAVAEPVAELAKPVLHVASPAGRAPARHAPRIAFLPRAV